MPAPPPYYPGALYTPILKLALFGTDEIQANNMVILDSAFGSITGTPGGTTGQVQYNNAGVFGVLAEGTAGQVLTSNGHGVPPSFQAGAGGTAWSSLTSAVSNLTLTNGAFSTEFDQTGSVQWFWNNTTPATALTVNNSPIITLGAQYWTGSASALDMWTMYTSVAAGANQASTLNYNHIGGTTGAFDVINYIANGLTLAVNSYNGQAPAIRFNTAGGSQALPTALPIGTALGSKQWAGYTGTHFAESVIFIGATTENWSDTNQGAYVAWAITPTGFTTKVFRMGIDGTGNCNFGTINIDATATSTSTTIDTNGNIFTPTIKLRAAAPTVAASQVGLGSTTAATATVGGGQATPATVLGYLIANVAGTTVKIPYYAA